MALCGWACGEEVAAMQEQTTQMHPKDDQEICSRLDTVFLVSYDRPQTLVSAKARIFRQDEKHVYIGYGSRVCAINMESKNGEKPKWFTTGDESVTSLSPLIYVGHISFSSTFVSNVLSDAGSCYVLPDELPPMEEHHIKNLPAHMQVDKCTAMSQNGKLLLLVVDTLSKKDYYVFYDVASSSVDQKYYEVSGMGGAGLVWNGSYVWELSVSKWGYMFYQMYSLDAEKLIKEETCVPFKSRSDESPVVTAKGLFLVDVKGNRPPIKVAG